MSGDSGDLYQTMCKAYYGRQRLTPDEGIPLARLGLTRYAFGEWELTPKGEAVYRDMIAATLTRAPTLESH